MSNSTHADEFKHAFPDRYFEMFISEQQLVAAATGLTVRGHKTFASTFAAFFTRAFDFVRMGAISGVELRLSGSHCGVEIGADGPSQMGLEDLAMMRSVHGSTRLVPERRYEHGRARRGDGTQPGDQLHPHHARRVSRDLRGAGGVRSRRFEGPALLRARRRHARGRRRHAPRVPEGGRAVSGGEGIQARVVDCYSVKPIDVTTVSEAAAATSGRIVVAEDHHPEGGLGSAVTEGLLSNGRTSLHIAHLAVRGMPGSGTGGGAHGVGRHRRRPHRSRGARARARRLSPARAFVGQPARPEFPVDTRVPQDSARRPGGR